MKAFNFEICSKDPKSKARTGVLMTDHGAIRTPIFMPVGTAATVKAVHFEELKNAIGAQIILANTYHLFLRPGEDLIAKSGGIHRFMGWKGPVLTDSGGYQVYSLSKMRKLGEQGVQFRSHIDGSLRFLSPEYAVDIQRKLGPDFLMAFDECTPYPCDYAYAQSSMDRTHRWLDRCLERFAIGQDLYGYEQCLAPIVQGSVYKDLRRVSAEYVASKQASVNAIGGLSVGEPTEELLTHVEIVNSILPEDKPRYLMGVGTPYDILQCISLGVDMFDCVLPTRNARHGLLYTTQGIINIKNARWAEDFTSIDPGLGLTTSIVHSKAYLRHLFVSKESLGAQLASLQNLRFYLWLIENARTQINEGNFSKWRDRQLPILMQRL